MDLPLHPTIRDAIEAKVGAGLTAIGLKGMTYVGLFVIAAAALNIWLALRHGELSQGFMRPPY